MLIHIPLRENPPTVTSQEKGETIRYKWIIRNGKRVSVPYIHMWAAEPFIEIEINEAPEFTNEQL